MAKGQDLVPTGATDSPLSAKTRPREGLLGELRQDRRVYLTALKLVKEVGGVFLGPLFTGGVTLLEAFADAADDAELEANFAELRDLSTRSDEKLQALAALAQLILVKQDELAQRLDQQGTPAEQPIDEIAKATALVAYNAEIAQRFFYADYRGIAGSASEEHVASFPADRIYVTPRLHAETDLRHERDQEDDLQHRLESVADLSEYERRRLEDELAALRHSRWAGRHEDVEHEDGKPVGGALISARHCVILGPPGVGKSALTRYLARTCGLGAEAIRERLGWDEVLVPILLPLAAYAEARRRKPDLSLVTYLQDSLCERHGTAVQQAVAEAMQRGDAIVLLDGVDEVPEESDRLTVVRAVDTFLSQHRRARCIVTSRPAGYFRLAGHIPQFELRNFRPSQVREFVGNWQKAFEERRHPEHPDFARAQAEAEQMVQEIESHPRVAALARNPLMLVIVALIRHHQLRLPERRVELYQLAVRMLLDTWNRLRSEPGIDRGGTNLPLERLLPVWGRVAEWMRREQPTGFVHRAQLKRKLIEVLEENEEEEPSLTAESYLEAVVQKAGLLEERFRNRFAFWHPTFEEFLAAVSIATPSSATAEKLLPLRANPRWREVILLALGYIGIINHDQASATSILRTLLERDPDPLEPVTHANLRLAAACIADDIGVRRGLVEEVLVKLADALTRQPYGPIVTSFRKLVEAHSALRLRPETVDALAPLTSSTVEQVRIEATRLLSNVARENPEALRLCRERLADDDELVCLHAAIGLARTGDFSPRVCNALGEFRRPYTSKSAIQPVSHLLLTDDAALTSVLKAEAPRLRLEASRLLIEHGREDERVFDALASVLEAEAPVLRVEAAQLLIEHGRGDERVFDALASVLEAEDPQTAQLSIMRSRRDIEFKAVIAIVEAARLLIEQGREDERLFEVLASLLGAKDPMVPIEAARLLIEQGRGDERVFEALAVSKFEHFLLWLPAAQLLIEQGRADRRAFEALVSIVGEESLFPTAFAMWLLSESQHGDERAFEVMVSLLGAEDPRLRLGAVRLLIEHGRGNEQAFEALGSVLEAEDRRLRLGAARLLIEHGRGNEQAFEALGSVLGAEGPRHRAEAARLLIEHGRGDERVFEALASVLKVEDPRLRRDAARLLVEQGRGEWVAEELVSMLGSGDATLLAQTLQRVFRGEQLEQEDGEYLAALVSVQESDDDARRAARSTLFDLILERTGTADS